MTNQEILANYQKRLKLANQAIESLKNDKRIKSVILMHKFENLRNNYLISIESLEQSIKCNML